MSAILNSLNVHNFLIFQLILMTLVSKFMVQIALSDKTYLLLGLRSPLMCSCKTLLCFEQLAPVPAIISFFRARSDEQFFFLAKINCHRNYGKVFSFTHIKEKC